MNRRDFFRGLAASAALALTSSYGRLCSTSKLELVPEPVLWSWGDDNVRTAGYVTRVNEDHTVDVALDTIYAFDDDATRASYLKALNGLRPKVRAQFLKGEWR